MPDVAANASPSSGFRLYVARQTRWCLGGTSAATPLWAGLIALLNQGCGRNLGNINPILYGTIGPAGALRGIAGSNTGAGGAQTAPGRPRLENVLPAGAAPTGSNCSKHFERTDAKLE